MTNNDPEFARTLATQFQENMIRTSIQRLTEEKAVSVICDKQSWLSRHWENWQFLYQIGGAFGLLCLVAVGLQLVKEHESAETQHQVHQAWCQMNHSDLSFEQWSLLRH
ncbi:MAG: hypothetical protein JWO82_3760 [Akkermansiaceae bacterium]|nr:hypothetical protein [Akkermansiaceae bacterium]